MEKSRYDEYMNNYLRKSGAKLLNKDPTTTLEGKWDKIRQKKEPTRVPESSKIANPACPRLFAQVKTHKTPVTFRLIVEKCRSPLYNLERKLAKWFNLKLSNYNYGLSFSISFLQKLKRTDLDRNETLATYDFEKLYQSLNITAVSLCLYRFLLANTDTDRYNPYIFREITDLLCHNSYFCFDGKFSGKPEEYQQGARQQESQPNWSYDPQRKLNLTQ